MSQLMITVNYRVRGKKKRWREWEGRKEKIVRQKEAAAAESTRRMECCWNDCKRVKERKKCKEKGERWREKKWVQTDKPTIAHEMNEWMKKKIIFYLHSLLLLNMNERDECKVHSSRFYLFKKRQQKRVNN